MRLPASIIAGALIPLGFGFALPVEGPAFAPATRQKLITVHRLVAIVAYSCLVTCIVYSSVSINSLAEVPHEPATSVTALLKNEYLLPWVATNVTFLLGLSGALLLVALRTLLTWEADEGRVAAGVVASALLLMASVVDDQVQLGGFAPNLLGLVYSFVAETFGRAATRRSPLLIGALVLALGSSISAVRLLLSSGSSSSGSPGDGDGRPAADANYNARALTTSQVDTVGVGDTAAAADAEAIVDGASAESGAGDGGEAVGDGA